MNTEMRLDLIKTIINRVIFDSIELSDDLERIEDIYKKAIKLIEE